MLLSLLVLLACGGDDSTSTQTSDTSDTSDSSDSSDTSGSADSADTGETNDTADTSTADTSDTSNGDSGDTSDSDEPLPECDLLTPYRGCTANVTSNLFGLNYYVTTWDADGRVTSDDTYAEAARTTFAGRTSYLYTDGLLTSIERSDATGNVWGRLTYTYNADGNLTQLFDGDNRTTYQYNREGRLVSRVQESRGGMPIVCTWTWTTTATGADYDEDCMGYRASGSVDTRGLETFRVIYDRTSGDHASETTKVWRTDCQPVSEATDRLLGGTDSSIVYAYDASGRQTGLVSESASGTLNATSSFTCPD